LVRDLDHFLYHGSRKCELRYTTDESPVIKVSRKNVALSLVSRFRKSYRKEIVIKTTEVSKRCN
ncbi:hypothetical protein X777_00872, partial [Ooceraea biroi]